MPIGTSHARNTEEMNYPVLVQELLVQHTGLLEGGEFIEHVVLRARGKTEHVVLRGELPREDNRMRIATMDLVKSYPNLQPPCLHARRSLHGHASMGAGGFVILT